MSVYMLNIRLREAQAELANATDQEAIDRANLRISHIRDAIRDVEAIEWNEGPGWRSRERNAWKTGLTSTHFFLYNIIMIKVIRNPNFSEWWNILVNGKLVDNARSHAHAMVIASRHQTKDNQIITTSK